MIETLGDALNHGWKKTLQKSSSSLLSRQATLDCRAGDDRDPGKNTQSTTQELLMGLRDEGLVKFDIIMGLWSRV
jgi:hypothetical protein